MLAAVAVGPPHSAYPHYASTGSPDSSCHARLSLAPRAQYCRLFGCSPPCRPLAQSATSSPAAPSFYFLQHHALPRCMKNDRVRSAEWRCCHSRFTASLASPGPAVSGHVHTCHCRVVGRRLVLFPHHKQPFLTCRDPRKQSSQLLLLLLLLQP